MAQTIQWTLGDRMAKARRSAGITNTQMADRLMRDRRTITNYERDHTKPTDRVLRAWAEITGVSLEWLTDTDGYPERAEAA